MIVLDTNIYSYLAQSGAPERPRAEALMDALQSRNVPILIPTVCIAEYLTRVPATLRTGHLQMLAGIGTIVPFDIAAALIAATIHSNREAVNKVKETSVRKAVMADIKVLATAIAHGATQMYSHNVRDMRNLAKAGHFTIQVSDIPDDPHAQLELSGFKMPPPKT